MSGVDLTKFNTKNVVENIVRYILPIMFMISTLIMVYLSFIDSLSMPGDWRSITLFGISGATLSYLIWLTSYQKQYENMLNDDRNNNKYSIHKRYYFARKGWKLEALQERLEKAKVDFKNAWLKDIEEMTGRSVQEIKKGKYRGYSHKVLIYRVKHNLFPKYGVRYARELLQVLNVGYSPNKSIDISSSERYFKVHATQKVILTLLILCTTGSIVVEFLTGSIWTAIFKLVVAIISLIVSLLFGSINGYTGAKKKLAIAETVSETLEEWRDMKITEEPFKEDKKEIVSEVKVEQMEIPLEAQGIVADYKPVVNNNNSLFSRK